MSRSVSLDFGFERVPAFAAVVEAIRASGGRFVDDAKIFYMENSNDMYDWTFGDPDDESSILSLLAEKAAAGVTVGIHASWPDAGRGGTVLVVPSLANVSFTPFAGSPMVEGAPEFTSLGWFLDRLTADFAPLGLQSIEASDIP